MKVRMGTKPLPHAGMGVPQYAWSTSPLRRYVDLVNQWQIIACARHGRTAALAAPFRPKDATLFSIISSFDATYAAYNDFQHGIERYWTLRWLQQQAAEVLDCAVMKDGLVRADTLPLVLRVGGTEGLPRGTRIRARVTSLDLLTLDVHGSLVERLAVDAVADGVADDTSGEGDDEGELPGALTIAVDVDEPAADAATAGGEPARP
jgi:exoribonuclease-2